MPTFNVPIGTDGVILDLVIGLSAPNVQTLRRTGRPVPAPMSVRALADTGADTTFIDPSIVALLTSVGFGPIRLVLANVPALTGFAPVPEYSVSLEIVHPSGNRRDNFSLRDHPAIEQPLQQLGYEVLIGRDVLDLLVHIYNGPSRIFTLAY